MHAKPRRRLPNAPHLEKELAMEFKECSLCATKPGMPTLCESCLANREIIENQRVAIQDIQQGQDDLREILAKRTADLHKAFEIILDLWKCGASD